RKLIADAKFFELRSSMESENIPDPHAGYNLKLEMDGKTHTIWVVDGDLTPSLKVLVGRLKDLTTEAFCRKLIGLDFEEAKRQATAEGYKVRLAGKDGARFFLTTDWCPNRINVVVEKGKVVEASAG